MEGSVPFLRMADPTAPTTGFRSKKAVSVPSNWGLSLDLSAWIATSLLPFALVLYLGLKGGGYDEIIRSEVGIAIWWIVLIGAAVGLLPIRTLPRWALAAVGAMAAFALWTALGIAWSESAEQSLNELARVLSLLGILALALLTQGPGGLRRTVGGIAAAIAILGVLALWSRLQPGSLPSTETADFVEEAKSRLSWPLNYWNGLGTLLAMGIPLLLSLATAARLVLVRALSAGVVPALALAAFLTLSRGGAVELGAALVALVLLSVSRAGSLPTWGLAGAGSVVLIAAALQRDAVVDGLTGSAGTSEGDELLAMTFVTCAAVMLLVAALQLAFRAGMTPAVSIPRRVTRLSTVAAAVFAVVGFVALGGPGAAERAFEDFKSTEFTAVDVNRFESVSGNQRWQYWTAALDANASAPLNGIGPGTYQFWWAANGSEPTFIKDAHSLYLEVLAELGLIGLLLLLAFLVLLLTGLGRAWQRSVGGERKLLAGAIAGVAAFLVAAGIDWAWELTVLPVCFLLLAAAAVGTDPRAGERAVAPAPLRPSGRVVVGAAALTAIIVIALQLASAQDLRASEEAAANVATLPEALERADEAADIQPFAASPPLQRALVLERGDELPEAAEAARQATEAEPTNWRTWFVLARIEAARGDAEAAVAAFKEARALNPNSLIFSP